MLQKLHALDMEKNYQKYLKAAILVGVLFKLLLMGLFSSDYQDMMFIPFVKCFLNGENPYQFYYDHQLLSSFPYPPVMLFVECIGGIFVTVFSGMSVFARNLVFKLPILLMDLLGLYYLMQIFKDKRKYILIFLVSYHFICLLYAWSAGYHSHGVFGGGGLLSGRDE